MAAPATHESKPGSTARDAAGGAGPQGTARDRSPGGCRARANRLRRSRARTMAPHNPTTGLFQGDGGWFRAGAEDSLTEEVLIKGGDAGVDGVNPARPFGWRSMAPVRRDKRENRTYQPLVFRGDLRELQDHNSGRCRHLRRPTRSRVRMAGNEQKSSIFRGTRVCRHPRNSGTGNPEASFFGRTVGNSPWRRF